VFFLILRRALGFKSTANCTRIGFDETEGKTNVKHLYRYFLATVFFSLPAAAFSEDYGFQTWTSDIQKHNGDLSHNNQSVVDESQYYKVVRPNLSPFIWNSNTETQLRFGLLYHNASLTLSHSEVKAIAGFDFAPNSNNGDSTHSLEFHQTTVIANGNEETTGYIINSRTNRIINVGVQNYSLLQGTNGLYYSVHDNNSDVSDALNITADRSKLYGRGIMKGAIRYKNGRVTVALKNGSSWTIDGNTELSALNNDGNSSLIFARNRFEKDQNGFTRMVIHDYYEGEKGSKIYLNAAMNTTNLNSPHDHLLIIGDASGTTSVIVNNRGGLGGLIDGDGINLITVNGDPLNGANTFISTLSNIARSKTELTNPFMSGIFIRLMMALLIRLILLIRLNLLIRLILLIRLNLLIRLILLIRLNLLIRLIPLIRLNLLSPEILSDPASLFMAPACRFMMFIRRSCVR